MSPQTGTWIGYAITAAVIAVVLLLRVRNMRRARRLRLGTLWIVPAIVLALTIATLWNLPPHGVQFLWLAVALAAGAALGWRRGMLMRITIDPETHRIDQQASPAAMLFILVILVLRQGLRYEGSALGMDVAFVTDLLLAFALGLIAATRAEMFLRARRLLAMARAGA